MKKHLVLTIGLGVLIIFILSALLFFLKNDISKKTDKIKEIKQEIILRSKIISSLSVMRGDINLIQPYIPGIDNFLFTKDQLINFSKELDGMAAQDKINISSSFSEGSGASEKPGELKWIGLTSAAEGNFNGLIRFLKSIENSRYSVKLENIDLSEEKDSIFKMIFNGKVFYF